MNGDTGPRRSALRIALGALVVLLGLTAVVIALLLALRHYPSRAATQSTPGDDESSAVVAVLTPVVAAIAGIVGLYFGISATGSARGQQAQTNAQVADSVSAAARSLTSTAEVVHRSAAGAGGPAPPPAA